MYICLHLLQANTFHRLPRRPSSGRLSHSLCSPRCRFAFCNKHKVYLSCIDPGMIQCHPVGSSSDCIICQGINNTQPLPLTYCSSLPYPAPSPPPTLPHPIHTPPTTFSSDDASSITQLKLFHTNHHGSIECPPSCQFVYYAKGRSARCHRAAENRPFCRDGVNRRTTIRLPPSQIQSCRK
jgi:hypothetical protein